MAFFPDQSILLALDLIFVPSIKMVSPEILPRFKSALDISARMRLEQGENEHFEIVQMLHGQEPVNFLKET